MNSSNAALALTTLNATVALIGAAVLVAAALHKLNTTLSGRAVLQSAVLILLAGAVLTRGAPHNNELLFALQDRFGAQGVLGIIAAVGALALLLLFASRWHPYDFLSRNVSVSVAVLAVLASLEALNSVVQFWNAPPWGDALTYDHIAISIARGTFLQGSSYYMPLFQYASAIPYWMFGHFFFVAQIVNVLLASITVIFLALAARNFFYAPAAILFTALLAATVDTLRHATFLLQVENYYIPLVCFSIWALSRYYRTPTRQNLFLLGLSIGLVLQLRAQSVFFVGWLCLGPFLIEKQPMLGRLKAAALIAITVIVLALPWTVRNILVDGRVSVVGTQVSRHVSQTNTERGFYGIRRDLMDTKPAKSVTMFERLGQMAEDPGFVFRAAWWRGLTFYNLLPPGIWEKSGPRPIKLADLPSYVMRTAPMLTLLLASIVGLIVYPGCVPVLLLGSIAGHLAIIFVAGFSDPRVSYPVLPLHMLLAVAALFPARSRSLAQTQDRQPRTWSNIRLATLAGVIGIAMIACHMLIGRHYLYPPQTDASWMKTSAVDIDRTLPDLNAIVTMPPTKTTSDAVKPGMKVRLRAIVTNYMEPVKWFQFPMPHYPDFAADPSGEAYFRSYMLDKSGTMSWDAPRKLGIGLVGARIDRPMREDDAVEIEGEVLAVNVSNIIWIRAEQVRHLDGPPGTFERFEQPAHNL